jgi:hypothetical protein
VFSPTEEYRATNGRRLGRPPPKNPDEEMVNDGLIHDLNMGYYTRKTITPHSPIAFHKEETEFYHPWSLESIGEEYGYGKLEEIIPLTEYLTLPNTVIESVLAGVIKGKDRRFEETKEKEPKADDITAALKKSGLTPEQLRIMKDAGVLK